MPAFGRFVRSEPTLLLHRGRFLVGEYNEELDVKDATWFSPSGDEMPALAETRPMLPQPRVLASGGARELISMMPASR